MEEGAKESESKMWEERDPPFLAWKMDKRVISQRMQRGPPGTGRGREHILPQRFQKGRSPEVQNSKIIHGVVLSHYVSETLSSETAAICRPPTQSNTD